MANINWELSDFEENIFYFCHNRKKGIRNKPSNINFKKCF